RGPPARDHSDSPRRDDELRVRGGRSEDAVRDGRRHALEHPRSDAGKAGVARGAVGPAGPSGACDANAPMPIATAAPPIRGEKGTAAGANRLLPSFRA